jgi:hypothetical protein
MTQEYPKRMSENEKKNLIYQDVWNLIYFTGYEFTQSSGDIRSFIIRKREITRAIKQLNEDWELIKRRR